MKLLVTGGAGFIGSNFVHQAIAKHPDWKLVVLDKLTYAGNLKNLEPELGDGRCEFVQMDICDREVADAVAGCDAVIHFAAESHVDRSIVGPRDFIRTNIEGTFNLLEACRKLWKASSGLFHHVSTDEVYGSLGATGFFTEETRYDPSSPYSASKASSDHLVRAYARTYGMRTRITNCSNNYGPYQFPEKLIPLMILNCLERKPLPVYGRGENVRDWLYVSDHCEAIWRVIEAGRDGETYNIGGNNEVKNLDVVHTICKTVAEQTGGSSADLEGLITYVQDRPGHDLRYAIDASKVRAELGWAPTESFQTGLGKTVSWYLNNPAWVSQVRSGEYRKWLELNYASRGGA